MDTGGGDFGPNNPTEQKNKKNWTPETIGNTCVRSFMVTFGTIARNVSSYVRIVPEVALGVNADWSVVTTHLRVRESRTTHLLGRNASWSDDKEDTGVRTSWGDGGDVTDKSGAGAGPSMTYPSKAMG